MERYDDERNEIYELQNALRALHFDTDGTVPLINPDGLWSNAVQNAVIAFQRLEGLPPTGQADGVTYAALLRAVRLAEEKREPPHGMIPFPAAPGYEIGPGDTTDAAAAVQFLLRAVADEYETIEGPPQTGVHDEATVSDVRRFQTCHGLPATGNVDKRTWNALADAYNKTVDQGGA